MLYPITIGIVFFFFNIPIINLLFNALVLFIITLNYKANWKRKISAVCFIYAFMFITDILVVSLSGYFYVSPVQKGEYNIILGFITVPLMLYFEAILAQNFKNIRKNNPISPIYWFSSFAIPVSSTFIIVLILSSSDFNQTAVIFAVIAIFLMTILTFYLHDSLSASYADKLKSTLLEQEKEYFFNQCELMRESTEDLKSFKHDVKNHFFTIVDFIKCNKSDEAIEYLIKLIGDVTFNTSYSDTGNTAIDSIINYKLRNAKEKGIELKIDVSVPPKLNIEVTDVITILGNLLDNAIDAVLRIEERRINLKIDFDKGRLFINTENTFSGEVKHDGNGEIISVKSGSEHGYGLKNIQKSVDKYDGYMEINHVDNVFNVDILLYIKSI